MKNRKKIVYNDSTLRTIRSMAYEAGLSLFGANAYEVSVKDNTLILKPTVTPYQAKKLAESFILEQTPASYYDFEVNDRQRVVACAVCGHVGVAYCSEEDMFNVTIGKALALSRALRKPLPKLLQTYLGLD